MKSSLLAGVLGTVVSFVSGSTFSPVRPPAVPLAGIYHSLSIREWI